MWQKGSITVFYSLMLTLILALISSFLLSARVSAGRAQIAIAMDQAMYSEMAKYDQALWEEYHVLFLDGGLGFETLQMGKILDELTSEVSYGLAPSKEKEFLPASDFLQLDLETCAVTGYTLATDQKGRVFREQVVQYQKNKTMLHGISSLLELLQENGSLGLADAVEEIRDLAGTFDIESLKTGDALSGAEKKDLESDTTKADSEPGNVNVLTKEEKETAEDARDVLISVNKLKNSSILHQVVKSPERLSDWEVRNGIWLSERALQRGFGVIECIEDTDSLQAKYFFLEYLLEHFNHYTQKLHHTGPSYGLEYLIGGRNSDIENLEQTVKQLILFREAANVAYLYTDREKRAEASSMAALLAMAVFLPELQPVLEAALMLAWAYVESLVDVRGLLLGNCVPLWKSTASWQVGIDAVSTALTNSDACIKSSGKMDYSAYLACLLLVIGEEKQTMRCMDVIEQTIREIPGKENFSMDCAIDALEVQMHISSERKKTFEIIEKRSYRKL